MDRQALSRAATLVVALAASGAALATAHTAYNLTRLRRPIAAPVAEKVSVLIPARDEAERIGGCLSALVASNSLQEWEILVLDDGSTDGTAAVVREVADVARRIRLVDGGGSVPLGWLGKTWACARLAELATGTVLVFLDADVLVAPDGVAATVTLLRSTGLQLVSPYPRQLADGPLPRLVQPLLQWSWLTFLPLRLAERSVRPSLAAANGQFLAVDSTAYRTTGGHGAVRGSVLEDIDLLKAFKRNGFRGTVVDGTDVATCRMYASGTDLVAGYRKSMWAAFGSRPGAIAAAGGLALLYLVPPAAAVVGPTTTARRWGLAGYGVAVIGRALVARRTGQRVVPDVLAHPASVVAFLTLLARSWRAHDTGTLAWRGRHVPTI